VPGKRRNRTIETARALINRLRKPKLEINKGVVLEVIEMKPHKKWRTQGDDLRSFLGDFVASVPQFELPAGLNLPPAMAANLTNHKLSLEELLLVV
jgi:hypothetical protein